MNSFALVVTITMIAGVGGTGLGGLVSLFIRRDSSRVVSLLLSFAGGIMAGVVCFDMIPGAINPEGAGVQASILFVALNIFLGYAVVWLLNVLIDNKVNPELEHYDERHPETADDLDELIHSDHFLLHKEQGKQGAPESRYQLFVAGIVMACAIALHNIPEGMVIGASYAGEMSSSVSAGSGLLMAVIIGLHNIPEGMAVAVPLIAGGTRRRSAVLMTAMSGLPTVIGAIIGFCLGTMSPFWLSFSLSFASGAMLYVVFGELLPEAILMWRSKLPAFATIVGLLLGLLIIYM